MKVFGNFFNRSFKIIRIFSIFINIFGLLVKSVKDKSIFIHFKALEYFPFNILYLFNSKNVSIWNLIHGGTHQI